MPCLANLFESCGKKVIENVVENRTVRRRKSSNSDDTSSTTEGVALVRRDIVLSNEKLPNQKPTKRQLSTI